MGVVIRCPFPGGIGIHAEYRMQPERRVDFSRQGRRPRMEAEMSVMASPLGDFNAVQWSVGFCVRHVNNCYATTRLAQSMPKTGLLAARRGRQAADVGRYINFVPTVELVPVGANPGCESHP